MTRAVQMAGCCRVSAPSRFPGVSASPEPSTPSNSATTHVQPQHPTAVVQHTLTPAELIPIEHRGVLVLGDRSVTFDKWIPLCDPPGIHFSQQISELFHHWNSSDLVMLNGEGVPVKYWDKLFKYLAEEMQQLGSEDAFWAKYTDSNGEKLRYKEILSQLKAARIATNAMDVRNAKLYFGGDLTRPDTNGVFMYRKGSCMHVLTKNDAIASAWRDLLLRDAAIALQWYNIVASQHPNAPV
ncbi:hypothetical protein BC835DRAFT_1410445 [Cytidiella melzeri]|nr:hypothetical protein BC835DRAFT_1410445 [Cytidiella melzeri]